MTTNGRDMACERCGAAFRCGAGTGACWCAEEAVRLPLPKPGASAFADCLCRGCMHALAKEARPATGG